MKTNILMTYHGTLIGSAKIKSEKRSVGKDKEP